LADNGHGCAYAPDFHPGLRFFFTVISGPRRSLAQGWPGVFAPAFKDLGFTGFLGLITAFLEREKKQFN
jgi:hypothetical protein